MPLNTMLDSIFESLPGLAPFHLLAFSTLLGTELYQSFVVTKVCYTSLPRTAFISLQKRLFPTYFQGQSLLLLLTALTFPPHSLASLLQSKWDCAPLAIAGITAGLNLTVYGPRTRLAMIDRAHQGSEERSSDEMQDLNRRFSKSHAMSIHLNLVTIGATLWYGWRLGTKLDFH